MTNIINTAFLRCILISALLAIFLKGNVAGESLSLDLKSAIDISLENNEFYLIAKKEVDRADGQVLEAVSGALPQITGGLQYNRNWRVPVGVFQMDGETVTFKFGTENSYIADLTVTQPIYSGGRTFTALKMARVYKKMTKEIVNRSRQDLKYTVYNSFYGALLADEIYRVNLESQRLAQENLDVAQKMYDQGMVAEYDLLRARVALSNIEPLVIKAENGAEIATSNLKNILGIDMDIEIDLVADFDSNQFVLPPIDPESAEAELRENRPEIKISRNETSLSRYLVSIARAGYKPTLSFSTSLQYQAQFNEGNIFDKKWDRSLNSIIMLSVPIFDSWRTPSKVKQAKAGLVQSRLREESLIKSMILDFEQNLGKYNEARKRLSAQGDAVELARRGLSIASVRYENGIGTQLEVSDARLAHAKAEINRAVALHDLAVSYAALMRAMGRDIGPAN
jgi:HAE1 family hydrophobic/amphiphilic exporter-1